MKVVNYHAIIYIRRGKYERSKIKNSTNNDKR